MESAEETEETTPTSRAVATPTASSSQLMLVPNQKGGQKVDAFLASLRTAGSGPSLGDLERGRPCEHAHPESTLYAKQYNGLLEQLDRSFTKEQLRRFGELYQLDPRLWRSGKRKANYARAIVENAWGWPSLREIEKAKRERTEIVTESKQTFSYHPVRMPELSSSLQSLSQSTFPDLGQGCVFRWISIVAT